VKFEVADRPGHHPPIIHCAALPAGKPGRWSRPGVADQGRPEVRTQAATPSARRVGVIPALGRLACVVITRIQRLGPALRGGRLDERAEIGWISSVLTRDRILPCAGPVRAAGGLPPARRAGPDRPDRPGSPSSRDPVTCQVTTAPGSDSRRQTSSDGPITLISADPTRCDLAGRTHSPCNGEGQRTNPGHIRLLHGIESDNHRSGRDKHLSTSRYSSCQRDPHRLVSLLILKSADK
jgi:hypothetical protein